MIANANELLAVEICGVIPERNDLAVRPFGANAAAARNRSGCVDHWKMLMRSNEK